VNLPASEKEADRPGKSPRPQGSAVVRFAPLLILLLVAVIAFLFVDAQHSLTGRPTVDMLLGLGLLNLSFYLWIRLLSGFPQALQAKLVVVLLGLQLVLFGTIQMEGVYGNGRPVFAWRWNPLPADELSDDEEVVVDLAANGMAISLPDNAAWPQFRGHNRTGVSPARIPDWSKRPPREAWRKKIGAGWSSFAVAGDYFFTMEQRGDAECTTCYELESGRTAWMFTAAERFSEITGGEGPRSTPTFDNGFLYTMGATGVLNCLDAVNGQRMWSVDVLAEHDAMNCYYGMCASPLIDDNRVIVNPGGKGASLAAYDKRNGDLIWAAGDAQSSYASPQRVTLCGIPQILNFNADGLFSHRPSDGKVLWQVPWISNQAERNNVCQPIQVSGNRIFISSGYGQGCALFQLSLATSDGQADSLSVKTVWQNRNLRSKFASAVFDGRHIYGLDEGILVCLDAATGERTWKSGRYQHGQLLLVGDKLIVQAEDGSIAQVVASSEGFVELARINALSRRTWTHPVIVGKFLLTRNDREIVCFHL